MRGLLSLFLLCLYTACASPSLTFSERQMTPEQRQARYYATGDRARAMRAAMNSMQDMGFAIEEADAEGGTLLGNKRSRDSLKIQVLVEQENEDKVFVKIETLFQARSIEQPKTYRQFFSHMSKELALPAEEVERIR